MNFDMFDYLDYLEYEEIMENLARKQEAAAQLINKLDHMIIIVIRCDAGYGNTLYIRGNTWPLRWSRGEKCRNIDANTWVYEMECSYKTRIEFKVLLNDSTWETGNNHVVETGYTCAIQPSF